MKRRIGFIGIGILVLLAALGSTKFVLPTVYFQGAQALNVLLDTTPTEVVAAPTPVKPVADEPQLRAVNAELLKLLENSRVSTSSVALEKVVERRFKLMRTLIAMAPGKVGTYTVSSSVRSRVPSAFRTKIEERVTLQGKLVRTRTDTGEAQYQLRTSEKTYDIFMTAALKKQVNGGLPFTLPRKARVTGYSLKNSLAATNVTFTETLAEARSRKPTVTPTTKYKVGLVLLHFENEKLVDYDTQSGTYVVAKPRFHVGPLFTDPTFSARAIYRYSSQNKFDLVGAQGAAGSLSDIKGPLVTDYVTDGVCRPAEILDAGNRAMTASGLNRAEYDAVLFVFPYIDDCWFNGLVLFDDDSVRSNDVLINGGFNANGKQSFSLYAHELGHTLGLQHSNAYVCKDKSGNPISIGEGAACQSLEYGDFFDVMGKHNPMTFNVAYRNYLGILANEQIMRVATSGIYTIYPRETSTKNVKALRIPYTSASSTDQSIGSLVLEYRVPPSRSSFEYPVMKGVWIYRSFDDGYGGPRDKAFYPQVHVLDATPGSDGAFTDAGLRKGTPWVNPYWDPIYKECNVTHGTSTIEVVEETNSYAKVKVTLQPNTGNQGGMCRYEICGNGLDDDRNGLIDDDDPYCGVIFHPLPDRS